MSKKVKYFKARRSTPKIIKGQTVYICKDNGLHLEVLYLSEGNYTKGLVKIKSPVVGEVLEMEVEQSIYERINS